MMRLEEILADGTTRRGRQARLLALVVAHGRKGLTMTAASLARHLGASVRTIRDDVRLLSSAGWLTVESNRGCWKYPNGGTRVVMLANTYRAAKNRSKPS